MKIKAEVSRIFENRNDMLKILAYAGGLAFGIYQKIIHFRDGLLQVAI